MDSRLVMVVVMVAVACLSPGAKAQNTTSAMNVTTAANASISEGSSTAPGATGAPTTAPGATGAPTTAPGATGAPTTAPGATGVPTTAPGATGAPTTAPGATGAPTTAPGAPTGAPTTAPGATGAPTTAPGATGAPTTAPGATGAPTTAPGATGAPTTAPGATGAPTTAPGAPTGVPTTAPGATGAPTTAPGATGAPTTAPGAPTGAPTTAPGATGAPTTAPGAPTGAPTTAPGATGAPTTIQTTTPFVSNGTVDTLTTNITRDSCKKTQFCASEPSSCSPSSDSCYFVSAAQASGQAFSFQLNGPSTGYIAMGLASSAAQSSNITTYVCANRNGIFKFFTTYLNNGQLMMTTLPVNKVKGSVRGKLLQCAFTALLPSVTSKSADTSFIVSMSNGNFINDTLGTPVVQLRSSEVVDLSNPNTTVTNNLNATSAPTTVATTANHGITLQRSLSQALLILFGVLGMALL